MNTLTRVCVLGLTLLLLLACGQQALASLQPFNVSADADVQMLIDQRNQTIQRVQTVAAPVVLGQVETDFTTTVFRFTDGGATQEIMVTVPKAGTPVNQWEVLTNTVSPRVGQVTPDLPLRELRVGPTRVARPYLQSHNQSRIATMVNIAA